MASPITFNLLYGWVADTTPPSAPTNLSHGTITDSFGVGSSDLSWTASTDNQSASGQILYEVSRGTSSTGPWTVQGTTAAGVTTYNVELPSYATHWFRVRARDASNNWGDYSASYSITFSPPAPSVPQLILNSKTETTVSVSDDLTNPYATSWEFQRNAVTVQNTSSATLNDTGLSPGTTYTYRARAINSTATTAWSSDLVVVTDAPANTAPVASFTVTPNPVLEGASMTLTSTSTDADGTITTYQWELVSSPEGYTGTFSAPTSSTTTFTPSVAP